ELTYGLERITAFLQDVDSIYDIVWARDTETGREVTYREVRYQEELQVSVYNFEVADGATTWKHLELYAAECQALIGGFYVLNKDKSASEIARQRYPLLAAYDLCLKCSHLFNLLDARGAISVTERVGVMSRVRDLAVGLAKAYLAQQSAALAQKQKGE